MALKIGLKFYPQSVEKLAGMGADFREISRKTGFLELLAFPGTDFSFLKRIECPVTVHMDHYTGNLCDPGNTAKNSKSIEAAVRLADRVKSDVIVIHGGWLTGPKCSLDSTIKEMKRLFDSRMHIENLPYRDKGFLFAGQTPEDMKRVMEETGCSFCLDFSHAAGTACGLGKDYLEYMRSFLPLKPSYFHVHDGLIKSEICKHMHLGDGEFDLKAIKEMVPDGSRVCLETVNESEENPISRCFEDMEKLRRL